MNPFEQIYEENLWGGTESLSGPGSSFGTTVEIRKQLGEFVYQNAITGVLDAACGDGWWMPDLPNYIGVDLVPQAIARAKLFHPNREYRVLDIRNETLPVRELVILRDAIQHMTISDGVKILQAVKDSGARFLAATTYLTGQNVDVPEGTFYVPDLISSPFDLGEEVVADWPDGEYFNDPHKRLCVWEL